MKQKLFDSYMQEIASGEISETRIRALRRHLSNVGGNVQSAATEEQAGLLFEQVAMYKPRVSAEQSAKGLAWLLNQWRTPTGRERLRNPFNARHQRVLEGFSHFTLSDFVDVGTYRADLLPVYTVHATTGDTFSYAAGAWQSATPGIEIFD